MIKWRYSTLVWIKHFIFQRSFWFFLFYNDLAILFFERIMICEKKIFPHFSLLYVFTQLSWGKNCLSSRGYDVRVCVYHTHSNKLIKSTIYIQDSHKTCKQYFQFVCSYLTCIVACFLRDVVEVCCIHGFSDSSEFYVERLRPQPSLPTRESRMQWMNAKTEWGAHAPGRFTQIL